VSMKNESDSPTSMKKKAEKKSNRKF